MHTLRLIVRSEVEDTRVMLEPTTEYVDVDIGEYAEIQLGEAVRGNSIEIVVRPGVISVWTTDFDGESIQVGKDTPRS